MKLRDRLHSGEEKSAAGALQMQEDSSQNGSVTDSQADQPSAAASSARSPKMGPMRGPVNLGSLDGL